MINATRTRREANQVDDYRWLAQDRQAELLRLAAEVHLAMKAEAGKPTKKRPGDLNWAFQALRRVFSAALRMRRALALSAPPVTPPH